MDKQLLLDGFQLLVLGMGTVYVFLIVMIWMMKFMSKLLAPFAHVMDAPGVTVPKKATSASGDADVAAAAAAAVELFRSK